MPTRTFRGDQTPCRDTFIVSGGDADASFGGGGAALIGKSSTGTFAGLTCRALFFFDISSLPAGAPITSAVLTLTSEIPGVLGTGVYKASLLTQPNWTRAATWNKYDGIANWTLPGGDFVATNQDTDTLVDASHGFVFSELSDLAIQAIANFGGHLNLEIRNNDETQANDQMLVYTMLGDQIQGATPSQFPTLVITYGTVPPTTVDMGWTRDDYGGDSTCPQVNTMKIGETVNAAISFGSCLEAGETITGVPTVTVIPSGPAISQIAANTSTQTVNGASVAAGQALQFAITGGTAGVQYTFTATGATSATPSATVIAKAILMVEA